MGAKMPEEEMQPMVDAWRTANPHIVQFWYALGNAASEVIEKHNMNKDIEIIQKVKIRGHTKRGAEEHLAPIRGQCLNGFPVPCVFFLR